MILHHVQQQHASKCTIMHALFVYYYLGANRTAVARLFHKSVTTITTWIERFESTSDYERRKSVSEKKFTKEEQCWVVEFYRVHPIAYLDEAKTAFETQFKKTISTTTVWRIIHNYGLTWKVLERRAMHVRLDDVFRFCSELESIDWSHHLDFLSERLWKNHRSFSPLCSKRP
jgi:transposase